jgi:hypothetical protein
MFYKSDLFMPNKPNSPNVQMNLSFFIAMDYAIFISLTKVKNKSNSNPIQTQTKPILGQYQGRQSQYKAKTKPIQTQFQRPKMKAFAWIRSIIMIYYDFLTAFTTL